MLSGWADFKQPRRFLSSLKICSWVCGQIIGTGWTVSIFHTQKTQAMRVYGIRQPNITGSKRSLSGFSQEHSIWVGELNTPYSPNDELTTSCALDEHGTGMVRHLTLDYWWRGNNSFNFLSRRREAVWRNNPSQGGNVAPAEVTTAKWQSENVGESEVGW